MITLKKQTLDQLQQDGYMKKGYQVGVGFILYPVLYLNLTLPLSRLCCHT